MKEDLNPLTRPPADLLKGASLILDFDGTVVEIASTPEAVEVDEPLRRLLLRLMNRLNGRVAILTGRPLEQIERLIHPLQLPISGSHGLETRHANGEHRLPTRSQSLDSAIAALRSLEEEHPGVLIEEKPFGVALHFRQAADAEEQVRKAAERTAEAAGLELQPGKMVIELKPPGANKAEGLKMLMAAAPFRGTRPVVLGDDLTDEPAFEAAQQLGGAGIFVGEPRPTAARFRLQNVDDALSWLDSAAEAAR